MSLGLSPATIVNVQVNMSPLAAATRNFGSLLILGSTDVIDISERMRLYNTFESVATDFDSTTPEYKAANLYFAQSPQPSVLYIGRWAQTATAAVLKGKILTTSEKLIANFTAISAGGMRITVDGVLKTVSALDMTAVTTLNGAAAALQAKIAGSTVTYDAVQGRFVIKSATTGATSTITYGTLPVSGVDVAVLFGLTDGLASPPINGIIAESLADCVADFADMSNDWYGLEVVASGVSDADNLAVATAIEAFSVKRIFGVTTQNTAALDSTSTTDIAYKLKDINVKRAFTQYSSSNAYAAASIFGRAFTVNFQGSNTTLTLKFKQEPTVAAENITASQAAALTAKNCNVFVKYSNDTAILQEGTMANGYFFDEVHGLDWLENAIQTALYNRLYTSTTKVPQTDAGMTNLMAVAKTILDQAVVNGLLAPGQWNADGFGTLEYGDYLDAGYYMYCPPIATQSQADREARKSPPIQIALKLAGAIHFADVIMNVNR